MKKILPFLLIIGLFSINSCNKEEEAKTILKASIFADVQLTTNNQDYTSNAYTSLLDQLRFSKDNEVDVIFICGDLVNNAIESYYQKFEHALEKVYGSDKDAYPEFVYTMGNHEWWDINEQKDPNAVDLFRKYAHIESSNLIEMSSYKYPMNQKSIIPSYYKVVNGVPFISYSAESCDGTTSSNTLDELKSWLDKASELELVKKGGPIIIGYHYPLDQITYEVPYYKSRSFVKLIKDYPQAIVYTGDSHYPSINERTINQTDFTTINIGSSSYTRMINESALKDKYENVGSKSKDVATGDADFMTPYIENIQLLTVDDKGNTTIQRYVNNKNKEKVKKVDTDWIINAFKSKDDFIYTNSRFQNKDWALKLYNQEGLSFDNSDIVEYDIKDNKMIVKFKDVNNYNYCDHYKIKLSSKNETKEYNFVSTYHIYYDTKQTHCYIIDNVDAASNYTVEVEAYDFFDNVSLNSLISNTKSNKNLFFDDVENEIVNSYSNTSKRLNYEITNNSNASIEYYCAGDKSYESGIVLANLIPEGNNVLSLDVINNNDYELELFLEVNGIAKREEYSKKIQPNTSFESITWNLNDMASSISTVVLKAYVNSEYYDIENGYSMSVILDNIKFN